MQLLPAQGPNLGQLFAVSLLSISLAPRLAPLVPVCPSSQAFACLALSFLIHIPRIMNRHKKVALPG